MSRPANESQTFAIRRLALRAVLYAAVGFTMATLIDDRSFLGQAVSWLIGGIVFSLLVEWFSGWSKRGDVAGSASKR